MNTLPAALFISNKHMLRGCVDNTIFMLCVIYEYTYAHSTHTTYYADLVFFFARATMSTATHIIIFRLNFLSCFKPYLYEVYSVIMIQRILLVCSYIVNRS